MELLVIESTLKEREEKGSEEDDLEARGRLSLTPYPIIPTHSSSEKVCITSSFSNSRAASDTENSGRAQSPY